jgi:hypothetical protein
MNSKDKVVDLEENSKDRVKLCCLENLAATGLKANTTINVPVLTVDTVEERDGK